MSRINKRVQVGVFQREKEGILQCGDSYFYKETDHEFICAIADGLGSGILAKESSQIVIDIVKNNNATENEIIKECNEQLRGKRGVVLGILKIDFYAQKFTFSSIGNIGLITLSKDKQKKRMIPRAGYLAGYKRPLKVVQKKLDNRMGFIMFSDGVTDVELSKTCFFNKSVKEMIDAYTAISGKVRKDDTTLIVMRYEE